MKLEALKSLTESASNNDIPKIVKALIKVGAFHSDGIGWVDGDDDGKSVKGPDGQRGWFNDGRFAAAVKEFDPATIRQVVLFFWMVERLQSSNNIDHDDMENLKKIIPLLK
jgi:hypothetical protein